VQGHAGAVAARMLHHLVHGRTATAAGAAADRAAVGGAAGSRAGAAASGGRGAAAAATARHPKARRAATLRRRVGSVHRGESPRVLGSCCRLTPILQAAAGALPGRKRFKVPNRFASGPATRRHRVNAVDSTHLHCAVMLSFAMSSLARCPPQDSHDDSEGRRTALQQFWADLGVVRRVLRPLAGSLQGVFPASDGVQPRLIA